MSARLGATRRLQLSKNSTSHGTRIATLIDGWQRSIDSRMDSEKRATEAAGKFDQGKTNTSTGTRWKFRKIKSREYLKGIWPGFLGSGWLSWAAAKRWRILADSPGKQSACKSSVSRRRKRTEEEAKLTREVAPSNSRYWTDTWLDKKTSCLEPPRRKSRPLQTVKSDRSNSQLRPGRRAQVLIDRAIDRFLFTLLVWFGIQIF